MRFDIQLQRKVMSEKRRINEPKEPKPKSPFKKGLLLDCFTYALVLGACVPLSLFLDMKIFSIPISMIDGWESYGPFLSAAVVLAFGAAFLIFVYYQRSNDSIWEPLKSRNPLKINSVDAQSESGVEEPSE